MARFTAPRPVFLASLILFTGMPRASPVCSALRLDVPQLQVSTLSGGGIEGRGACMQLRGGQKSMPRKAGADKHMKDSSEESSDEGVQEIIYRPNQALRLISTSLSPSSPFPPSPALSSLLL